MSILRIVAIACIYLLGCAGWGFLGFTTEYRSHGATDRLGDEVASLWGEALVQEAPSVRVAVPESGGGDLGLAHVLGGTPGVSGAEAGSAEPRMLAPVRCQARVDLCADHRRKGLIWYPTYVCRFEATWTIANEEPVARSIRVVFRFPVAGGTYDGFEIAVGGERLLVPIDTRKGIEQTLDLAPGESREFRIAYTARGLREWRFRAAGAAARVRDLDLTVRTDFDRVDYPEGSISPMEAQVDENGSTLHWRASDLLTTQDIGVLVPEKLNPGPLTSRITYFAPVCLFFFFILVMAIGIVRAIDIHPMHYLFVTAGFFAFHLLLAYLVDHVDMHLSFAMSSAASVALVTTYLRAALGSKYPGGISMAGQLFFLVLFSYSFFLEGTTGLTVALGSVLTLAALMRVTAGVNWSEVFAGRRRSSEEFVSLSEPA